MGRFSQTSLLIFVVAAISTCFLSFGCNSDKVHLTEEGNPAVVWTVVPEVRNNALKLSGAVDAVVPTNDVSVTLYYQAEGSSESYCDVRGKPWMSIVEPLPADMYYELRTTSMWCEYTYGSWADDRVSGDTQYSTKGVGAEEIVFPIQEADVWRIEGKNFHIEAKIEDLGRPGVHVVELWAGPEVLAVHQLESPTSGNEP